MNSDGALATIIRATVPSQSATDADFRALAQTNANGGGEITDEDVNKLRSNTAHSEMPILYDLLYDRGGNLWVQEFAGPRDKFRRVTVYGSDGQFHGGFELSTTLKLMSIGDERIVVEAAGNHGGEMIQVFALVRLPSKQ